MKWMCEKSQQRLQNFTQKVLKNVADEHTQTCKHGYTPMNTHTHTHTHTQEDKLVA